MRAAQPGRRVRSGSSLGSKAKTQARMPANRTQGCARSNLAHSDLDLGSEDLEPTFPTIDITSHKFLVALGEIHDPFDDADHVHER